MLDYPIILSPDDNDTLLVECPDLPEVLTFGSDEADALDRALDAIETAIIGRMANKETIPSPSKRVRGQKSVRLPTLTEAKVALYEAMREQKVRKADLARKLKLHPPQIDRLLDLHHKSRLDQLDAALEALGKRLELKVRAAA